MMIGGLLRLQADGPGRERDRLWRKSAHQSSGAKDLAECQFLLLIIWLSAVFLLGGGSRGDITSLTMLRPVAVLVVAYGLLTLTGAQVRANRVVLGLSAMLVVLVLLQLAPLPPALWQELPGRSLIAEMDLAIGLGEVWRPLSLTPTATWNALWSLMVPISVLVLAVQLERRRLHALLPVILLIGCFSGLLGMFQMASGPNGPLYFYRVTHNGMAVGLFANRNHQALLLAAMVPMVMVCSRLYPLTGTEIDRWRAWAGTARVLVALAVVLPLVLVTGSRGGMIAAIFAVLASPLLFLGLRNAGQQPSALPGGWRRRTIVVGGIIALIALTLWLDRAVAFTRLLSTDPNAEMRLQLVPTLLTMTGEFWPVGSGFGSFPAVYQVYEPDALLGPFYMNQAHNDWLDVPLTGGFPAVVLLAFALTFLLVAARNNTSVARAGAETALIARLGVLTLTVFGLGSISDYPLRVPSLACLAVIAVVWVTADSPASSRSDRHV